MTVSDELLSLALFLPCLVFSQHNYLGVIVYVQGFIQTFWQGGQSGVLGGGRCEPRCRQKRSDFKSQGGVLRIQGGANAPSCPPK